MLKNVFLLEGKPVLFKIFVLILLILLSTLITFFTGLLAAIPLFDASPAMLLQEAGKLQSAKDIQIMKFLQIINQLGVFIIPSLLFAWMASTQPWRYLAAHKLPDRLSVLVTALLIFTMLPTVSWLISINEQMQLPGWLSGLEAWMRSSEEQAARLTRAFLDVETYSGLAFNIFMVGVVASLGEELLFRSVMIRLFKQWFGNIHVAVIVSSILFSLFHLQFFGFLPRLMLGLVMGYLFVWSGSLWLPVIAHFVNNASAVVVYFFYFKGATDRPVEQFGNIENNYLFVLSIALSISLLLVIYLKNKREGNFLKD
jgi:membrane protease YdiL (CAAX protease family)